MLTPAKLMRMQPLQMVATSEPLTTEELPPRDASWNPLGLFGLSKAPTYLDGSLAGDVGFDPLGLVAWAKPTIGPPPSAASFRAMPREEQQARVEWMREAELKHARLAMLAAAGWPIAELFNGETMRMMGTNGRAPAVLNGGFFDTVAYSFVGFAFAVGAFVELTTYYYGVPGGDYGFDPLGYSTATGPLPKTLPKTGDVKDLQLAEIKNGRLAMLAITGFAVQEFFAGTPVVEQTPFFFGR